MKHINYEQFCKIKEALFKYVDNLKDPYNYLFEAINGYPFGHERVGDKPKKLLNLAQIKRLWDSQTLYKQLLDIAIMKHYFGNTISRTPNSSEIIDQETLIHNSYLLLKKFKNNQE